MTFGALLLLISEVAVVAIVVVAVRVVIYHHHQANKMERFRIMVSRYVSDFRSRKLTF
jgi:hypothetical protein